MPSNQCNISASCCLSSAQISTRRKGFCRKVIRSSKKEDIIQCHVKPEDGKISEAKQYE